MKEVKITLEMITESGVKFFQEVLILLFLVKTIRFQTPFCFKTINWVSYEEHDGVSQKTTKQNHSQ